MGTRVFSEIGTLISSHPYLSCSLLVFLTPPFFPILKFFSPLLISTAVFILTLVTMGPQFQDPSDRKGDFQSPLEDNAGHDSLPGFRPEDRERDFRRKEPSKDLRSTLGDWFTSCKDSGLVWVEQKLRNEDWRGAYLNDDNVSILQEAFALRAEDKPRETVKLATRRIPAGEERTAGLHSSQTQGIADLTNLDLRRSSHLAIDRSFERPPSSVVGTSARDLPHNIFSPLPSFSRGHGSVTPFENAIPPPIEHHMPPLVTGPAEVTGPLYKSFEDDMDTSDEEFDHHHFHHDEDMYLEVGERPSDSRFISRGEKPAANGTYNHPPPFTVQEDVLPSSSDSDEDGILFTSLHHRIGALEPSFRKTDGEVHNRDINVHDQQSAHPTGTRVERASHHDNVPEGHSPPVKIRHEEKSVPAPKNHSENYSYSSAAHKASSLSEGGVEWHEMPELEDIQPAGKKTREFSSKVADSSEFTPSNLHVTGGRSRGVSVNHKEPDAADVSRDHATVNERFRHGSAVPADLTDVSGDPPHFAERSMSLPGLGGLADTGSVESAPAHEDPPSLDESLPDKVQEPVHSTGVLNHSISSPGATKPLDPIIIPRSSADQGPVSPDTDFGYATTPDHERRGLAARRFLAPEQYDSVTSISGDELEHGPPVRQLSTKEKIEQKLEALSNSMPRDATPGPADVSMLGATTDEQVTHVADKMKSFVKDSPSKTFHPDAPELQIKPPSTKVPLNASPSKPAISASALPRRPIRSSRYSSTLDSSEDSSDDDEQIDLDSDIDSQTDSEVEIAQTRFKPPPKPSPKLRPS
ncbi:uncharacterized protein [Physcomitrium patens]|uniref:Uncharacterized protein n=1 Tax=Physcomitrium patens TaxID=3218 RepID=A9STL2_PHYPA|nr:uncharacterized protein LOC112283576 [Physcomitrium patens]XP_024378226.1 uncharacterized protein LOC112283576 [Physcomitrium patens]XP_024378227.1 uncharacterized protein LOC112283576 [Physcomitrium patens]XP_024378228.1 uncharacterized protein LOC112283576 [Physcomitrium patens]XP_024378229.1 uncharacterized protein LOC112283576 [Physcomitrium patens]XP_024378230.1 uncharacterized protein LOC112283576 [Physcomitrium patens]XP_024378231.1 uncharacterized protein LOC112283576 [Physcomitriu|eukprot:XP_024378225.1 uncharacterized protein LOC112283576 [Physcomitrella patens]